MEEVELVRVVVVAVTVVVVDVRVDVLHVRHITGQSLRTSAAISGVKAVVSKQFLLVAT